MLMEDDVRKRTKETAGKLFGKGIKMDQLQKMEFGFGYYYWFYYAEVCPTPGS